MFHTTRVAKQHGVQGDRHQQTPLSQAKRRADENPAMKIGSRKGSATPLSGGLLDPCGESIWTSRTL
ncbi:hypothetical protein V2G26_016058 [Clonostachys chloroleuca]